MVDKSARERMKNVQNKLLLAAIALFIGTLFGSLAAYASKIILRELPPLTVLFLRLSIMLLFFLPVMKTKMHVFLRHIRELCVLGLFFVGNLIFFIVGIKTATVLVSGLLYATAPITVLFLSRLINKEPLTKAKGLSVILGFIGALIILFSSRNTQQLGSFEGTLLLFIATVSYAIYLVYSRTLSFRLTPVELTAATTFVGWTISFVVMFWLEGLNPVLHVPTLSLVGWIALAYLGIFLGVAMYILIQWGVRHGGAHLAASMQYVGLVLTSLSGMIFLGEKLTLPFILGACFIITGLYLITLRPAFRRKS